MFKKKRSSSENSEQKNISKDDMYQKKIKLSSKQKLAKLFLTSDLKNTKLRKPLRFAKSELIQNFHDSGVDVEKVNILFRIYFHDNKDVFIPKYLKGFTNNCSVFVDRLSENIDISLYEYLKLLKAVRVQIEPFTKEIQKLLDVTKEYASKETDTQNLDVHSSFDQEESIQEYSMAVKQGFDNLLLEKFKENKLYTEEWLYAMYDSIGESRDKEGYKDLILFSVFGMHYFDKKPMVYGAFTSEQLNSPLIFSIGLSKHSTTVTLTLKDFLVIIDQLNFKKHFFDL